jgi:hypothetical protein
MSDNIAIHFKIGGTLKRNYLVKFSQILKNCTTEMISINGAEVPFNSIAKAIQHAAPALKVGIVTDTDDDGCENIKTFCRIHKLTYEYFREAKYDYNAELCFWEPGMKEERCTYAMQSSEELVAANEITPLCNFMFEALKYGMHYAMVDKRFKDLNFIKEHKSGLNIYNLLEKELKQVLWIHPAIPPFGLI